MPNQEDVINAQAPTQGVSPSTPIIRKLNDILNQPLEKVTYQDKSGEYVVHTFHPHNFTKDYIEGMLVLSKKLNKEIYVVDWTNNHTPEFCQKELESNSKAYFMLVPNPEAYEYWDANKERYLYFSSQAIKLPFTVAQFEMFTDYEQVFRELCTLQNKYTDGDGSPIFYTTVKYTVFRFDWTMKNDCSETATNQRAEIFAFLIKKISYVISNLAEPLTIDPILEADRYNEYFTRSLTKVKNNLESKLKDTVNQLLEQQKALFRYEKLILEINDNIRGANDRISNKESITRSKEQLQKVFTSIFKDKFKNIYYGSDYISAQTQCIYIDFIKPTQDGGDGATSHRYKMGEYEIQLYLTGHVKLINIYDRKNGYDHPHVSNGIPCLGNLSQSIPRMIAEGDYLEVLLVMYDYLKTINRGGWYTSGNIYNWPVVKSRIKTLKLSPVNSQDMCGRCGNEQDSCSCQHCEHCDRIIEDCDCVFCEHCDRLLEDCDNDPCSRVLEERESDDGE